MDLEKKSSNQSLHQLIFYRLSQFIGFLVGAKIYLVLVLVFALYVSTFFLFNQEESLRFLIFDFKIHLIIFCLVLTIIAGSIINQFYDREKDVVIRPFRAKLQRFLKQKYFLYAYLFLNIFSLGISVIISWRVFIFLLIYQFLMWFYSHKLSKILIVNNLTFVALSLYPFFGMMVYSKTFSYKLILMAVFLFLMLWVIDVIKDTKSKNADKIFGYDTIPNSFSVKTTKIILTVVLIVIYLISMILINNKGLHSVMSYYFAASLIFLILIIQLIIKDFKHSYFFALNFMRLWLFIGIIAMLLNGILLR